MGASGLNQLVELARDGSPDARGALLRALTDLFLLQDGCFKATELQHFDIIMSRVAAHADAQQRRDIAERLVTALAAPRGLMNQLARDDIVIAEPVLRGSPTLTEDDLIAVIHGQSQAHMKAIAKRRELSPAICDALADYGGEDVLISLAKNQSARFNAAALRAMAVRARKFQSLQEPMVMRYDLPPQVLTHLYFMVAAPLRKEILKRSDMLDPSLVQGAVTANRHRILTDAMAPGSDTRGDSEAQRFIAEQIAANAVNEQLLKSLLAERRHTEFLFAFAHYVGVDLATAKIILNDKTFESLAIACRASKLGSQTFAKMVFCLRKSKSDEAQALRILDLYLKVRTEAAERMMRFWRMRTEAAIDAARISRLSGGEPPAPAKRAEAR